jgi:hypothetical protein
MNGDPHVRAQKLMAESLVEGISSADQAWLATHLQECADCAREAALTQDLLHALHTVPVAIPSDLAARTQLRVRMRAQEAAQSSHGGLLLWTITGLSWILGVVSAPLVWRGFAWIGGQFGVPKLALEMGFVLWWAVPALIAIAVVLHQRALAASPGRRG